MEDVQMFHYSHETFDLPFSFVQIVVLLELRNRQHVLIDFRVVLLMYGLFTQQLFPFFSVILVRWFEFF